MSKVFQIGRRILVNLGHPTPVHVIRRLCPRRGLGLWLGRGSWAFNSQPLKLPPPPNLSASLTPSFPIKRKSRKLNPKLPPPLFSPKPRAHQADCLQKLNQILGRKSQKSQGRGGSPRCMGSVSGPIRPNSLQHCSFFATLHALQHLSLESCV